MKITFRTLYLVTISALMMSCGGSSIEVDPDPNDTDVNVVDQDLVDIPVTTLIGGKMFSIPSPIQMVNMIKDKMKTFNEDMTTNPENVANFTTEFKRALNMGIYGADLSYATIYENNTKAVSYLSSIETLSDELGIAGAFDQDLLERFIDNGNNQDSMLVIMAEGYRDGDKFLKENEEHDIATLILTGGWIEAMYFAAVSYEATGNQDIANRIGEQKTALGTIIELLDEYNLEEMYTDLISDLKELKKDFDEIEFNYTFIDPKHNADKHESIIKSKSSVKIGDGILENIIEKVKNIRNGLIG
jgi:hypothetical protein